MSRRQGNSRTQRIQHRASHVSKRMQRKKASVYSSAKLPMARAPRLLSLSPSQLKKRADVFAAHADMMRNPELTASRAAEDNGITTREFWAYAPKAFKKDSRGRIRAVADRYVRRMEIFGPSGPIVIKVRGSKARSDVARFRNDVFDFLGGNVTALDKWKGMKIQGHELLTDPQIIRLLGEQDNLPEHFGSEQVIPYSRGAA
jgi:hypothetical protein